MPSFGRRDENRILTLVDKLQRDGQLDLLETELERYRSKRMNNAETESWHHFWGIAAFQRGDREQALYRFQQGHAECPDSSDIAFSLGQEYEFVADISKMLAVFDEVKFPKVSAAYALAQARYAYLWGRLEHALAYTLPLLDAYYELKIADDHFVYVRGLPFFGETWSYIGAFLELQGDLKQLDTITTEAEQKLADFDFSYLRDFIACIHSADFTNHMDGLRTQISEHEQFQAPTGVQATKLAILNAQGASQSATAFDHLHNVEITQEDFPWLSDMLLLGQCEVADRFDLPNADDLGDEFVRRQALLFEPNHAFNFRMLAYQETLKPRFQRLRVAG